jgi:hypothetical protein
MTTYYNWAKPIRSYLNIADLNGLTCTAVDNGNGWVTTKTINGAVNEATACDEAQLSFVDPEGKRLWVLMVLGNEPEELICDYTVNDTLERTWETYHAKWRGKSCPTITRQ